MLRKIRWVAVGLVIAVPIIAALVGVKVFQFRTMKEAFAQMVIPPTPVNVAEAQAREYYPRVSLVGSVEAVQGTVISTEVAGTVREILFEAGSKVEAGDVLVRLDAAVEQAQLRAAEAQAELARTSYNRAVELIEKRSIPQSELDTAESRLKEAEAQVDYLRAVVAKKTLRAPFAGRLGIRRISVGQFLEQGSPVVSLQTLDPVYVGFSVPQNRIGELATGMTVQVTADAHPGKRFEGEVTAYDPNVDPATRNVRVQATLANQDELLRPGMFVTADLVLSQPQTLLFIPITAVMPAPFGDSVFVVEEGAPGPDGQRPLVLRQQVVRLGVRQGDFVAVTDGLEAGQQVVSTGVFKLQPGMTVVIDNRLAPAFNFTPDPGNT